MSASLFPSNFTLYNFHPEYQSSSQQKLSLVDVSCQFIVRNHALTVFALETVPTDLYESLLKAALKYSQDKSVEEIISRWPWHKLVLKKLMPPVFNSMKPLFNKLELTESARRGVKYTTSLVHTFMECLKKQKISQLCFLDLTGYPSVEVIINYLAAHVLLIYNEKSQREIITFYNEIAQNLPSDSRKLYSVEPLIPDKECTVCLDVTIESSEAHLELCRALSVVNKPKALLKVAVSQLDISAAGVAMVVVLLELIDPKFFRGVNLQYNGISNASLRLIAPCLQRFGDLVSLDISYNSLNLEDDETAKSFVSIFSTFSHLNNLNLSHIKLGTCLSDILSQLSHPLVMLRLSNCNLANADIICLHKSPVTKALRELELSKNNLMPCIENLNLLISHLSSTLILLELEDVGLSSDNLLSCFEKSMLCQKLKFLNVSNNSSLRREAIMDSLVYFFVSPELEAVRISFPSDLSTDADNVTQSQQDFSSEIEKIIYCLCLRHKRMFFRIVFQKFLPYCHTKINPCTVRVEMPAVSKSDFREEEVLQAVVIADSFDKKFHPLTLDKPKVLLQFLNAPLIEYVLKALLSSGIQETFIFCCHQPQKLKEYLKNSKWTNGRSRMKIHLIISDKCDSVGDALRDISNKDLIRSDFVLLHGDTIFNTNLSSALKIHKERKQLDKNITLTMIVKETGIDEPLRLEEKFLMLQKQEKRVLNCRHVDRSCSTSMEFGDVNARSGFAGLNILDCQISVCSPIILHLMIDNFDYQSINDLVKGMLVNEEVLGNSIYYHMLEKNEYASRVWGFQSYAAIAMDVLNRLTYPLVLERNVIISKESYSFSGENVYLHTDFQNTNKSLFVKNVVIGKDSCIGRQTVISNSVIGRNCRIGNNVSMNGCFIFDNVVIEDGCHLSTCFVSENAHVYENVQLPKGCVLGNDVKIFSTDSLSCNTRLVSSSMDGTLEALSKDKGAYVYFSGNVNVTEKKFWDWGEIVEALDDSSFGESDSEDEEYDDSKLCYNEFIKNLKRSILENVSTQNVILEMNSAKHAYGIQIRELHILLMRALLDLPNKLTTFAPEITNYFSRFGKMMKHFLPLLRHYIKSREAERDVLIAMEEACESESEFLKSFVAVAKFLYDEDILSEEEIIAWWKDETTERIPELEEKVLPFINWLETAEEDSSEDSD